MLRNRLMILADRMRGVEIDIYKHWTNELIVIQFCLIIRNIDMIDSSLPAIN